MQGLKRYKITGKTVDGHPVELFIGLVTAFDAASAKRKAFTRLGGFTIGYTIEAEEAIEATEVEP
mgnify:CR=1 FL=1